MTRRIGILLIIIFVMFYYFSIKGTLEVVHAQDLGISASIPQKRTVRIIGRRNNVVTTDTVRLRDVATVSSPRIEDNEALIALQKIHVRNSPPPGKKISISAARVLERLREEGVDIRTLGYALPKIMTVERASRIITSSEIRTAIEEALDISNRDVELKSIKYDRPVRIAPGVMELSSRPFSTTELGEIGFALTARVENQAPVKFSIIALVDEWREVPTARRPLLKGSVIGPGDVAMARMSTSRIPSDAALNEKNVVGLEVSHNVTFGEVFRRTKLNIPPVIESGNRVTMVYKSRLLRATASGIALDSGAVGQSIRVRNEGSKKIIMGTIIEPGMVGVAP